MSTINSFYLKLLFVGATLIGVCSCTKKVDVAETGFFPQSQFSYYGATPRNLGLQFVIKGHDQRTVTAVITLPEYLDFKNQKISYRWQLDEGIEILNSTKVGEIAIVTTDKKVLVELTVNNFTKEAKKFIRFEASSSVNGKKFYIDGIVSSQSESSFENFVQGIENYIKKEHLNDKK